jgi:dUTP pyrophosphatase
MLKIKRLHPDATVPTVAHPGEDLGYDLYAVKDYWLHLGLHRIGTGIAAVFIDDRYPDCRYGLLLRDRSSMAVKAVTTSGGVIDAGYRGEIVVLLRNDGDSFWIRKGDKIAQMIPTYVRTGTGVVECAVLPDADRGDRGFGSSGV